MSSTKSSRLRSGIAFVLSGVFVLVAAWLLLNRQYAIDQLSVWSYEPSADIQTIEQRAQFSEKGKFVFYATKPSVESQDTFNENCPRQEAASPILGCYTTSDRIYIYDLTNEKLDGIEEVTAVHEMLHAVWSRTSPKDRETLESQLRDAYSKLDNAELKERMGYYERTEPGEFANELHSILGTEVASLGEPLESYYTQYFNRETILVLHDKYNEIYTALYSRADDLYKKMESLASSIESRSAAYEQALSQYTAEVNSFNTRANNGSFTTQSQFNSERAALVARQASLDVDRDAINRDITTYNTYYSEYQDIAKQIEVLNESLDSFHEIDQAPSV